MRLNKYLFNRVNNKERERGQRSVVWFQRGQPCLHRLHVLSTVFSWRPFSSFSRWIILLPPSLPPLILPLLNQCDGCLVPLAWWLMAGGRGFASHGGITLSRGWPCQRWKPLDIPGTHLHSATQLLIIYETIWLVKETIILPVQIKTTTIKWLRYHIIPLFPFHQCTGCYLPEGPPVQKTCIHYSWQFWNDWN